MSNESNGFCLKMMPCECGSSEGGETKLPDLSYEEQYAGFKDQNGDKVYMKSVDMGILSPNRKVVPHNILNIKDVIDIKSRWSGEGQYMGTGYTDGHNYTFRCINNSQGFGVQFITSDTSNSHLFRGKVIIYYTCTDR